MTSAALSALADAFSLLANEAPSHAREILALTSLDADEASKVIKDGETQQAHIFALREDARRLERDGERLGIPLGPGLAALIRSTLGRL
jgi:hypothetical protein